MWIRHKKVEFPHSEQKILDVYRKDQNLDLLNDLYDSYIDLIFGVALKYLGDEASAKDVVMDVYEHISKKLKTHEVTNFKSWLHQVTKNHCLEILRKRKRRNTFSLSPVDLRMIDLKTYDKEFEIEDENPLLKRCLKKLPHLQKECIQSFFFQEESYKEIANKLQITVNRVRSSMQNGRRNLKLCLTKRVAQ